jgi:hypothetical protein
VPNKIRSERELREQWQNSHVYVHKLEREARDEAAKTVAVEIEHINGVRKEIADDRLMFTQQLSTLLNKDDFRREHSQLNERMDTKAFMADKGLSEMREWRANLNGRIWIIPAVMSCLILLVNFAGIYIAYLALVRR